ncbi:DUF72 domain-containing protein [Nocardia seriolae]|uniref:Uncharacterized protein n=2 Tax=Nocardia seriolae TaxID=37332 RepID=A0A0B8N7M4_9NOCA|nr:DUF72 domain-containing protein [Nocardia seriolae]MTJ61365.1 DUF72 domain-containing protein [Nocardia seriolae]MTJ75402.1 DUF72 domain-containing protein [Nocardia seriolae]MTJ90512.1 DUF72 domain-containing protein [Nocardia seriolae]MTK34472.1 DUF72 domain-containing protein [Nocardia seriolae]MTK39340.1 DUF72 domain-containing protein [Nocardia seriolae]
MRLYVGCAMWQHPDWQEKPLPPAERLRTYASWCNAVEGNTTFYAVPQRRTVQSWARQTDPDFRFVMKLPRAITHERRLTGIDDEMAAFLDAIEPLGRRLHALWVQLPASFTALPALAHLLDGLPAHYRCAVEVRHPVFFENPRATDQLESLLESAGAEWIPFDTAVLFTGPATSPAEYEARAKKPNNPRRTRALTEFPIVRYHGRDDLRATVEGWQPWVETTVAWLREGRSPTIFIHTPDNAASRTLARRFHAEVRARLPELDPLPDPLPTDPMTLF